MPLIKGKSPKAFEHNVKAEMQAGKPQDQSLAIAYSVKKKAGMKKKPQFAKGGQVPPSVKNEPIPMPEPKQHTAMPMPKPQKMALKGPKMVESGILKVKPMAQVYEDAINKKDDPALIEKEMDQMDSYPPKDETEHIAYDDDHALRSNRFAKGGMVNETNEIVQDLGYESKPIPAAEQDDDYEDHVTDDRLDKAYGPAGARYAEGGTLDDEEHASIAAAIMAKRAKNMMAEGGPVYEDDSQVDLNLNSMEQPNPYEDHNHEILKENYDSDMEGVDQPMDSNEHGHEIDSDEHDMISSIRAKMKKMRM